MRVKFNVAIGDCAMAKVYTLAADWAARYRRRQGQARASEPKLLARSPQWQGCACTSPTVRALPPCGAVMHRAIAHAHALVACNRALLFALAVVLAGCLTLKAALATRGLRSSSEAARIPREIRIRFDGNPPD
eukprot:scaffold567_cov384-Prasinococcus_capsulatus_cf.AAC.5